MRLLKQLEQPRITLDREDPPTQRGHDPGIGTKTGRRIDYRSITSTQKLGKRMPPSGHALEIGTNPLPRSITGPSKFKPVGPVFQQDVR